MTKNLLHLTKYMPFEGDVYFRRKIVFQRYLDTALRRARPHLRVRPEQQEELTLAVIGLSDQYELSKIAAHLAFSAEVWFEWSMAQRKEYIAKFNSMSVDDALSKKTISVNDTIA